MTDKIVSLASDFPPASEADWRAQVEKSLKGAPFERLISKTYDGLAIQPLYAEALTPTAHDPAGAPGFFPFTRGAAAVRDVHLPWDIRQSVRHPDPARANAEILEDLMGGVSSALLKIDPTGEAGIMVRAVADLRAVLAGVDMQLAPIMLDAGAHGLAAADALLSLQHETGAPADAFRTSFGLDPIGAAAGLGALPFSLEDAAAFAAKLGAPGASAITASACAAHEAGASEAQELGVLAASGAAYVDALLAAGLSLAAANATITFQLCAGAEYGLETAKIRAARRIWSRIMQAWGAKPANCAMRLHAITSRRMLTQRDPWVNLLRNTAACFAAGLGGADSITVLPFTAAMGHASALARRLARNTHIILQEESQIGRVADPAGGAWSVESHTDSLAHAGWAFFQQVERQGGILASLESGWLQAEIAKTRRTRANALAKRKDALIGVTEYPLLQEITPELEAVDLTALRQDRSAPEGDFPAPTLKAAFEALPVWRVAAAYERLRDAADAAAAKGQKTCVHIIALGPLAEHSARVGFTQNLLAAGGIACQLDGDFQSSGLSVACLCGADGAYQAQAADAARVLKSAGATWVILAGKPGEHDEAWRAAGVDQFIFAGQDALEALEIIHAALGLETRA